MNRFSRFLRSSSYDLLISFLTSSIMNFFFVYYFLVHGEFIYLHHDEVIWIKQVDFCGGNFFFSEQRWGLIVPLLCIMYPLRFLMPLYYFSVLRFFIVFFESFLLLKFLRVVFQSRTAVFFVYFSHFSGAMVGVNFVYSVLRTIFKTRDLPSFYELVIDGIFDIPGDFLFWELLRIFNPIYFMVFFIAFYISFVKFLERKRDKKYKILSGTFLGLLLYSTVFWWLYVWLSVAFFLIYHIIKKSRDLRDIFEVIILGTVVGFPALVFNYFQMEILQDSIKRSAMLIKVSDPLSILVLPRGYIIFFIIALAAFLISRDLSEKRVFLLLSSLCGLVLFFFEPLTGIYLQMVHHIWFQFKFLNRVLIGSIIERIESCSKVISVALAFVMFLGFLISWGKFFIDHRKIHPVEDLSRISRWVERNTDKSDVITMDDISSVGEYTLTELRLSMTGRYILHSSANYFSDFKDWEVFERFLLREKLLGSDIREISGRNCSWLGIWDMRACFGLPEGFDISNFDTPSYLDMIRRESEKLLSDESYVAGLMRKYKVDYVIRRKPKKETETYLHPITQIGEFYIYRFVFR